jgi:hypothetical protein
MHRFRIAIMLFFAFSTVALFAQTPSSNSTAAYVYVGTNSTVNPGRISAFGVHGNGSVTSVSGSPFSGPAQDLQVSSGFLWGTDGTNITTYTRGSNGALVATSTINGVAHNDTPEGSGVGAMTLDRTASNLYVGEINFQGTDNGAYAEFANTHHGAINFLTNSPISVDFAGSLNFSENNQFAYGAGCYFADWDVFAFRRSADGTLDGFDPGNTMPPNPNGDTLCPSSLAVSAKGYLAVEFGVAQSGAKQNIMLEQITSTGGLKVINNSVLATNFTGAALRFDPTGSFLAMAGTSGIELFKLSNSKLTKLGSVVDPGVNFTNVLWDNVGHAYAISNSALFTLGSKGLTPNGGPHGLPNAASLAVLPIH